MKKLRILVKVSLIKEYYLTLLFHLSEDESALTQSNENELNRSECDGGGEDAKCSLLRL